MKIIAAALLTACATTQQPFESQQHSLGKPALGAYRTDDAKPWFPALASEATLPSAAHIQRELSTSRDHYTLAVRLCVAPDGSVANVDLEQSTGAAELDRAAVVDIANWRYEPFTAPATIRVCKRLAIDYMPVAEHSAIALPLVAISERE